jgi:hypothetical protein
MPFERTPVLLFSLFAACSQPTGSYEGRIVDPWTGSGRGGVKVIARAPNDVMDAACQVTEGTTSSDGTFRLERTCAEVTYTLRLDDPKLFAPDLPAVKGGADEKAASDIAAWRVPGAAGVYLLRNDELDSLHMNAPVEGAWIKGTDKKEVALYPTAVPDPLPTLQSGDVLILSGAATIARLKLYPMIHHPAPITLELASGAGMKVSDAWYLGYDFRSDREFDKVAAKLDESKVKVIGADASAAKMIPADALAPGRYAFLGDEDTRMLIVEVAPAGGAPPAK